MASPISFGNANVGLQVGINYGSIEVSPERHETNNTQGGAIFSGSFSAYRDINIHHITTIRPLAHSLYKSLFTSSEFFGQVGNELGLLVSVLNATEENIRKAHPDNAQLPELNDTLKRCHDVLGDLSRLKGHFDNVGPQTQATWERMGWGMDELVDIRAKLLLYIQVLNVLNTNMIRSSHENVERMLKTFIGEISSGKRESSVISSVSTSSLSIEEKEGWRQLRKALQSIGITPEIFTLHRNFILNSLQALSQSDIEDYHINFATVHLGQGDLCPEILREPTDSPSGAKIEIETPATTAADSDPDLPVEEMQHMTAQLPTYNQGTFPILAIDKKPNRVARLLDRITHIRKAGEKGNLDVANDRTDSLTNVFPSSQAAKIADRYDFTGLPRLNLNTASPFEGMIDTSSKKNDRDSHIAQFSGFPSAMPISNAPDETGAPDCNTFAIREAKVMFLAVSLFEFNLDSVRREAGCPYLTYVGGDVFDVIGKMPDLWLAYNQDDSAHQVGWIWPKHFAIIP